MDGDINSPDPGQSHPWEAQLSGCKWPSAAAQCLHCLTSKEMFLSVKLVGGQALHFGAHT